MSARCRGTREPPIVKDRRTEAQSSHPPPPWSVEYRPSQGRAKQRRQFACPGILRRSVVPARSRSSRLHHLEDITVRVAEEEALKLSRALSDDQLGAVPRQALFQLGEAIAGIGKSQMPAVLPVEARRLEIRDLNEVQFLAGSDLEPGGRHGDVAGTVDRSPAERGGEEGARSLHIPGRQGAMQNSQAPVLR